MRQLWVFLKLLMDGKDSVIARRLKAEVRIQTPTHNTQRLTVLSNWARVSDDDANSVRHQATGRVREQYA